MNDRRWLYCPLCGGKTRVQLTQKSVLRQFPLYCPKCKQETMVDVEQFRVTAASKK